METTKTIWCFEDPGTADLFRQLLSDSKGGDEWITLDELILRLDGSATELTAQRNIHFDSLLSKEELKDKKRYLATIDRLREALILTDEDVDYCFSHLLPTPKNRRLMELFHAYLNSPCAKDWTGRVWELVERLKNFEVSFPEPCHFRFVRAKISSFLFSELSQAFRFAGGVESVWIGESWDCLPEPDLQARIRPTLALEGTPTQLLETLSLRIARQIAKGIDPRQILIPFHGSASTLAFLKLRLAHFSIPVHSLLPQPVCETEPIAKHSIHELVAKLRQDNGRTLKDRLKLSALFLEDSLGRRSSTSLPETLNRLQQIDKLKPEDREYLEKLIGNVGRQAVFPPSVPLLSAVTLVPFQPLPARKSISAYAYADRNLVDAEEEIELILRPREIDQLTASGFPLTRPADRRARAVRFLEGFLRKSAERRYLFLPSELKPLAPETRFFRLPTLSSEIEILGPLPPISLPERAFSATQLEAYVRCPAQYFFSNRLRLKRSEGAESQYPLIFGQAVHKALETFFAKYGTAGTHLSDPLEAAAKLAAEFDSSIFGLVPTLEKTHPFYVVLTEQFKNVTQNLPELERNLDIIAGSRRAVGFEKDFTLRIDGLEIRGQIDRLDETQKGSLLILDYKTGNVDFTPDHIVKGAHYQALVYLFAAELEFGKACAGILFYDLKKQEVRRGVLLEDEISPEAKKMVTRGHIANRERFQEIKRAGLQKLRETAGAITAGDFTPKPSSSTCGNCDYVSLCRRGLGYV